MILSFGYHGNSAAQVQLIPHAGLGWYEPWTGLYIQETQLIPRGYVFWFVFFFCFFPQHGRPFTKNRVFSRERLPAVGLCICHLTTGFISRWSEVTVQEPEDFVRLFCFFFPEENVIPSFFFFFSFSCSFYYYDDPDPWWGLSLCSI